MKCLALKLFHTNWIIHRYYYVLGLFIIGVLFNIICNKYWNYLSYTDWQPKHLIVRRPFSIVDFDDHEVHITDQNAHELIVRETDVNVVCKLKSYYCRFIVLYFVLITYCLCCSRSK